MKPVGDPTLAPPGPSAEAAPRRFLRSAPDTVPRVPSASGHRMFHQPSGLSAYCRSPAVRRDVPPRMRKHSGFPAWRRPSHPLWRGQLWVRRSADDPERHPCIYRCRGTAPPVPRRLPLREFAAQFSRSRQVLGNRLILFAAIRIFPDMCVILQIHHPFMDISLSK